MPRIPGLRSALRPITGVSGAQRVGSRQEGGAEEHGVLLAIQAQDDCWTLATATPPETVRDAVHPAWPHSQTPSSGPRAETRAATDNDNTRVGVHPRPLTAGHDRRARRRWLRQCPQGPTRDSHGGDPRRQARQWCHRQGERHYREQVRISPPGGFRCPSAAVQPTDKRQHTKDSS